MDPLGSSSNNQKYNIQEKRIQYYEGKMMQQTKAYLSFLAIILALISQSQANRIRCRHWWIPFILSLLSALYFAVQIFDSIFEYLTAHHHLNDLIHQFQLSPQSVAVDHVVVGVSPSEEEGTSPSTPESNSTESAPPTLQPPQNVPQPIHQEIKMFRQHMLVISKLVFTIAVTILVLFACYFVLCDGSETMEKTC